MGGRQYPNVGLDRDATDISGEIILLIDSDTRVPEDCFQDASLEMDQTPQLAIMYGTTKLD